MTFQFNKDLTYEKKIIDRIVSNRRSLENQLFIDRLLELMGVKAGMTRIFLTDYFADEVVLRQFTKYILPGPTRIYGNCTNRFCSLRSPITKSKQ